ncbi:MAG: hypothetical protein GWO08_23320, partial [Gammaproteobacteria bacterium]|nr:hypothetical protein [Gammaproteobacteria bacterium]
YPKTSAGFIYDALVATTLVQATETRASMRFWLAATENDVDGCDLKPESTFNNAWYALTAVPAADYVDSGFTLNGGTYSFPGDSTTITVSLDNADGSALTEAVD